MLTSTSLVTMNSTELERLAAMRRIAEKRSTQRETAARLNLSVRQVERLYAKFRNSGAPGLVSKRCVERANLTLQDRLVKELRLEGINDRDAGNAFLPKFMAAYNRRFGSPPRVAHDAHRPLGEHEQLGDIFTWQEDRRLTNNLTLHYKHKMLLRSFKISRGSAMQMFCGKLRKEDLMRKAMGDAGLPNRRKDTTDAEMNSKAVRSPTAVIDDLLATALALAPAVQPREKRKR